MPPSILRAICNIADFRNNNLKEYSSTYLIRINVTGEALEFYVKDAFCNSFTQPKQEKEEMHRTAFSWLGNQNFPPDLIIRGGDAFEIKKIESLRPSTIALNSSHPKDKLYHSDKRITDACKRCDTGNWQSKDLFYVIGCTQEGRIRYIFFVQGTCYAAERDVYERIEQRVKQGVEECIRLNGIEGGSETVELGRINRVDPLGITNLRIRGMWMIENPIRVFDYINHYNTNQDFSLIAIMKKEKFDSYPQEDKDAISQNRRDINSKATKIKDPNNPAELMDVQLITLGWNC
jgi:hypothetical protein